MSKYIKLEDAIKAIGETAYYKEDRQIVEDGARAALEELDAIEVSEDCTSRPRGEWIGISYDGYADGNPVYDEWECSNCGYETEEETRYCPNCGADMRGETE